MNIVNPCRVLVLIGAVVLGFGVRADGTLPIPGAESSEVQFPLLMGGSALAALTGGETNKLDISMSLDTSAVAVADPAVVKACAKSLANAYPAAGTVQVGDDLFDIQGLCAPKSGTTTKRSVVATTAGRFLQLDGDFKVTPATKKLNFTGSALKIDAVTTSPQSSEEVPSVYFTFKMDELPL